MRSLAQKPRSVGGENGGEKGSVGAVACRPGIFKPLLSSVVDCPSRLASSAFSISAAPSICKMNPGAVKMRMADGLNRYI